MMKDIVLSLQSQMLEKLNEIRKLHSNSSSKGSVIENIFREFLRRYLPLNCRIGTGEIIDSFGKRSAQTDIVVANQYHPFCSEDAPSLYFIEGINAVGEIKMQLTSEHLKSTIANSARFKQLRSKPGKNSLSSATDSDVRRYFETPPFFLFAFESQLDLTTIFETIKREAASTPTVDALFILDKGYIVNVGDGLGLYRQLDGSGKPIAGWAINESVSVLFDCLSWLSIVMPRIIRFEPILIYYLFDSEHRKE